MAANLTLPCSRLIRNNAQEGVFVDASKVPKVIRVDSRNGSGTFSPGDTIVIDIIFDEIIHVKGSPKLLLDVGSGQVAAAIYQDGSYTKRLAFKYIVESNHCAPRLDYLDIYSLVTHFPGVYEDRINMIRRASTNPTIVVNLQLPVPGSKSSLAGHSVIKLDCRRPHILNIWSPQMP